MNSLSVFYLKLSRAVDRDSLDIDKPRQLISAVSAVFHCRFGCVTRKLNSKCSTRILKQQRISAIQQTSHCSRFHLYLVRINEKTKSYITDYTLHILV